MLDDKFMTTPPNLYDFNRWKGLRIGLLGGSFNPPHAGHVHIARMARARFGLDFVWWIITPQNPLKKKKGMAPYEERCQKVDKILQPYSRQIPTDLEHQMGTRYTHETISQLRHHYSQTDFLWICGMDNAHIFHQWDEWQHILDMIPIAFIARPPAPNLVRNCPLRAYKKIPHYFDAYGRDTDLSNPGVYWLKANKMLDISSTKIRNKTV